MREPSPFEFRRVPAQPSPVTFGPFLPGRASRRRSWGRPFGLAGGGADIVVWLVASGGLGIAFMALVDQIAQVLS